MVIENVMDSQLNLSVMINDDLWSGNFKNDPFIIESGKVPIPRDACLRGPTEEHLSIEACARSLILRIKPGRIAWSLARHFPTLSGRYPGAGYGASFFRRILIFF